MLREAQKISRPMPLISGEVPRFHGGSFWHVSPASYLCYMDVGLAIGCHAGYQNVSRYRTRGESEDHTSEKAHKGSTLDLKPKADVTRSPRQGYQWPHKKDLCHPKILNEKIDIFCNRINSETRMPLCRCM